MMTLKGGNPKDSFLVGDNHRIGCTLIWDSGMLNPSKINAATMRRRKLLRDGEFIHKSKVLAKIRYYESRNSKTPRKMKLQFNDEAVQTHEYLREEHALEEYLNNNPNEKEAVVKEELLKLDDVDSGEDESTDEPVTPRDTTESPLRTNTAIGAGSGELSNYKPKHQEEFQFGMSLKEAEPVPEVKVIEEPDPDDLHLRPADEEDLHDFSTNETSDMLF